MRRVPYRIGGKSRRDEMRRDDVEAHARDARRLEYWYQYHKRAARRSARANENCFSGLEPAGA